MKYEKFENDCYNLYTIKTDKFKNCHLEIVFRNKCSKEDITYSALLFDTLLENTKEYNSRKLLARREQELYNLNMFSVNSRVGDMLITNVVADFLDPKYMDKDSLEEIIKLFFSVIFNPNVIVDEFDASTFEIISNRLFNEIDSLKEDPKQMSILNSLKCLDESSPRAWNTSGDASILKSITPKKLYKYYEQFLESSLVDIYIIGNLDMKEVNKLIKKYALFRSLNNHKLNLFLDVLPNKRISNYSDINALTQTNVVELYSVNTFDEYEINYVLPIFNLLWGSGSLNSKVYKSLRGENALCYNVSTFYQKYDRMIILHTAIDKENYNKAIKLIKNCFNEMKSGKIDESELENVKNIIITSLNLIYDSPGRLIDNYLFSNIANLPDMETRIDEFKKVTIGDLVRVSKKIKLILNYRVGE